MVKNKVLVIAYVFPPIAYAGTFRSLRLVQNLTGHGIEPHVLTIKQYDDIHNDPALLSRVPNDVKIYRTGIIDPWRKFQTFKKKYKDAHLFGLINKIISIVLTIITFPDHMVLWVPFAVFRSLKIINDNNIKHVYVSSPPHSTLLIGYILKKIKDIKFIADLRDPILGNVGDSDMYPSSRLSARIKHRLLARFERIILGAADTVITNTYTHQEQLKERLKSNKFHAIHNSFDRNEYQHDTKERFKEFTIAHIGSIYGSRRAGVLFRAIRLLKDHFSPEPLRLKILFVGMNEGHLYEEIRSSDVHTYVTLKGQVPHRDALSIMMQSHVLLVVKMTGRESLGQIPGKFFEYLGTGNTILCIGPRESEISRIIDELDVGYTVEDNEKELFEILKKEYERFLHGPYKKDRNASIERFSAERMAQHIARVMLSC